MPLVGNTVRGPKQILEFFWIIITNIERTNKWEIKRENTDLMRFDNCLRPRRRRDERSYSNQSIQIRINRDNTHLYIGRAHEEKETKSSEFGSETILESDLEPPRTWICRQNAQHPSLRLSLSTTMGVLSINWDPQLSTSLNGCRQSV